MAITNQERVGKAMELLRSGLAPFVAREFKSLHNEQADDEARRYFGDDRTVGRKPVAEWDTEALSYNGLVQSWPEIDRLAREGGKSKEKQTEMIFGDEE